MKRRKFINFSAMGMAGTAFGTSILSGFFPSCSNPNRQIHVALAGCTDKAIQLLTDLLAGNGSIILKQVYDQNKKNQENAFQSFTQSLGYSPEQASDFQDIMDDKESEAVFIFIPAEQIPESAIQVIKAGKDLYIDGEPTFSIKEGKQLADEAANKNRIVQCGFTFRSNPSVLKAKTYIDEGKLGQVVHIKIFCLQKSTSKPANTSRSLDLARFLTGNPGHPVSVYCYQTGRMDNDTPRQVVTWDFKNFTMKCESGSAFQYMKTLPVLVKEENKVLQWLLQAERIEIYGSEGLLHLDPISGSWQVQGNAGEVLASRIGTPQSILHIQNFISCVRSREIPNADISQGHLSTSLLEMSILAFQTGNKQLIFDSKKELFTNNKQANDLMKS